MLSRDGTSLGKQPVWWGLLVSGLVSLGGYAWLAFGLETGNSWPLLHGLMATLFVLALCQFVAWRCALKLPDRRTLVTVLFAFAISFRLIALFAGLDSPRARALADDISGRDAGYETFLLYDNDVWRFLWDGHVTTHGISPYRYSPAEISAGDELTAELLDSDRWWDVHDSVGFERLVTIYPPLAQLFFAFAGLMAPGSVFIWKALVAGLDLGLCWLLLRMIRQRRGAGEGAGEGAVGHWVLYAWSPLVIKEISGSGHFESLTTLLLLAGAWCAVRAAPRRAVLLATAAALTKLAPIVALPLVLRRVGWRHVAWALALGAVLCLPFAATLPRWFETVRVFADRWQFNAGAWALLETALSPSALASWICAALLAATVFIASRRLRPGGPAVELYGTVFAALAAVVLLSPAVMPWYLVWALPFAVLLSTHGRSALVRQIGPLWAVLCCLSLLSYYFYAEQLEYAWWRWVEYGGVGSIALLAAGRARHDPPS